MPIKKNREYRNLSNFELGDENDSRLILRGTPVVFDSPTCLFEDGGVKYYEVIDRHAFDECDFSDFIFNYNHGGRVYARNRNKTIEHNVTETALDCIFYLLPDDEGHKQLYRDIKTGLIDKMSFSFSVAEESYNSETHTRTILKVKKLYDVAAVDIPAYNDTSISARDFLAGASEKNFNALELERRKKLLIAKTYLF